MEFGPHGLGWTPWCAVFVLRWVMEGDAFYDLCFGVSRGMVFFFFCINKDKGMERLACLA